MSELMKQVLTSIGALIVGVVLGIGGSVWWANGAISSLEGRVANLETSKVDEELYTSLNERVKSCESSKAGNDEMGRLDERLLSLEQRFSNDSLSAKLNDQSRESVTLLSSHHEDLTRLKSKVDDQAKCASEKYAGLVERIAKLEVRAELNRQNASGNAE